MSQFARSWRAAYSGPPPLSRGGGASGLVTAPSLPRPALHRRMIQRGDVLGVGAAGTAPAGHRGPEELAVHREPRLELVGQPVVGMDRRHRAHGLAQPAVDAFVGLDVERAPALVDA